MLDKGLSQMKSIMSNKGPRFYHDINREKRKNIILRIHLRKNQETTKNHKIQNGR